MQGNSELASRIHPSSDRARYLASVDLIIWEELPMSNRAVVECVDQLLRSITLQDRPFGGKVVVALGDFRQVAPVVKNGGPSACFDASIRSSYLWPAFRILPLIAPIQNAADVAYASWVDAVGEGLRDYHLPNDEVRLDPNLLLCIPSYESVVEFLFPSHVLEDPTQIATRSFLSPLNKYVDEFNDHMLDHLDIDIGMFLDPHLSFIINV